MRTELQLAQVLLANDIKSIYLAQNYIYIVYSK